MQLIFLLLFLNVGPIASILLNKLGFKMLVAFGSLLSGFGFAISCVAPNVWFLYFSLGLVAGESSMSEFVSCEPMQAFGSCFCVFLCNLH